MTMARPIRIALDLAIGSFTKIRPIFVQAWDFTKDFVAKTPAKKLICNPVVTKLEEKADSLTNLLISQMVNIRNQQLPKEMEYLNRQIEITKQRIANAEESQNEYSTAKKRLSKKIKSGGSISWQYLKVEAAPPLTIGWLNGPVGKKLEAGAGQIIDKVINGIQGQITQMEQQAAQAIREKEAAIRAQLEKQKAEEKKKEEIKKAAAATAAKKAADEAKKATEAKAAEEAKKAADKKDTKSKKNPKAK